MKRPFLLLIGLAAPATAAPFQNIAALQNRVIAALGAGIGEPGGPSAPIDTRLKLAACPSSVTVDPPAMGAVALRCPAVGWKIRVPLVRFAGAPNIASAAAPKADMIVRKGDPVDLVATSSGFSVSVGAVAQEDGAQGSRIRVKTDGGERRPQGQILFAEVIEQGRVRLPGFN
ncbi:flagella basal body P-ring formation protein FlgA [Sphingomonas vulcanisoli]|uniref:Flagella basal body P-ring formation protein FlgA n=1 Tax=Sphingomonas vulcanisoli TaxID=1658060 RepID=A0ABX0TX61_9SPHN|nr:flagella basal body P-ring formation protein FlgA [Sphingomonas vulcanisoli]NIJ08985.1 flagella basal body P-ring formation protein FlgA [Sphingomonas vulcanisoli]